MNPLSPLTYYRRHKGSVLVLVGLISLATVGVCFMVRVLESLMEQSELSSRYLARFSPVYPVGSSLEPGILSQIQAHPGVQRVIVSKYLDIGVPLNTSGGFRLFGVREADLGSFLDTCGLRLKEGRLPTARTNELSLSEELATGLQLRIGDRIGRTIHADYYWSIPSELVLVGILESEVADQATGSGRGILTGVASYEYLESHELYRSMPPTVLVFARTGRKAEVDRFLETVVSSPRTEVMTWRKSSEFAVQGRLIVHLVFSVVNLVVTVVIALTVGAIHRIGLTRRLTELGLLHAIGHSRTRLTRGLVIETAVLAGAGWTVGLALSWLLFAGLRTYLLPPTVELDLRNLMPLWLSAPIPLAVIAFVALGIVRTFARLDAVSIIERGKLAEEADGSRRSTRRSSAKPLSSWTFYLRHRRRGLVLVVTMALMMVGVTLPVFLFAAIIDANEFRIAHLKRVSVVTPRIGATLDPGIMAQVRALPITAKVVPAIRLGLMIEVPPLSLNSVSVYGVPADDMQNLIELYDVELEAGRLPIPRSNEVVLSRAMARNRGLRVGDSVGRPAHEWDSDIPTELTVVGILSSPSQDPNEGDIWLGLTSYEYLRDHELYSLHSRRLLVVPAQGRKSELDRWLGEHIDSAQATVLTYGEQLSRRRQETWFLLLLFSVIESAVAMVAAIALAILGYILLIQRREEFGILHAIGHRRRDLVLRTIGESSAAVAGAWLIGAVVCILGLAGMQVGLYSPRGLALDFFSPVPWLLTLPMPLAVVAISSGLVAWMLSRLDPVSVIERR